MTLIYFSIACSVISIAGITYLALYAYPEYRLDAFRHEMFEMRAALFHEAAKGRISFESDAYRMLRNNMNGVIRFGYRLPFLRVWLLLTILRFKGYAPDVKKLNIEWDSAIAKLDEEQIKIILNYREQMHDAVRRHMMTATLFTPICAYTYFGFMTLAYRVLNYKEALNKSQMPHPSRQAATQPASRWARPKFRLVHRFPKARMVEAWKEYVEKIDAAATEHYAVCPA